jgi:hypothetical protein
MKFENGLYPYRRGIEESCHGIFCSYVVVSVSFPPWMPAAAFHLSSGPPTAMNHQAQELVRVNPSMGTWRRV